MTKARKRAAALILSLLLLIGSFADVLNLIDFNVFSAGEHNYIANNGDEALHTVTVQTGAEEYFEIRMLTDASPFGRAFSVYPKAADADKHYSIVKLPFENDWKLGKTHGIAFYVKLDTLTVSELKVNLRLNGSEVYAAENNGAQLGYCGINEKKVTWSALSEQSGVLSGRSAFEGFVFLPYSAFKSNTAELSATEIAASTSVELMLTTASTELSDLKKDYLFDEIGFYEGADSYIRAVKVAFGTEYVANSGENAQETVKLQWNCTDGQITYSQRNDPLSPYGAAIGLKTGNLNSEWNNFKTGLVVKPDAAWDISATTGYAFYCELPDVGADTALDIWWYINDEVCWNELQPGKPIYYIPYGSDEMETVYFSWNDYSLPGHDHGGYKGFIFVPFTSLKQRYNGQDRGYINNATYFEMRVGIARRPDQEPDLAEQTFVFDELGLYTDPHDYIDAVNAKSNYGEYELIVNDGTSTDTVKLPSGYNGVTVSSQAVGVTPYGSSIGITTAASGWNANKAGIVLDAADGDLSMTNGIAFYVKVPEVGLLDPAMDIWLWNSDRNYWNSLVAGKNIYYIAKGSTTVSAVEFQASSYTYPLHDKSGFEGFVFIPFDAFSCTQYDNGGKDVELMRSLDKFELRFNVAKTDAGLGNQTFVFDELGFYRDPVSYVAAAQKHREDPKQYNYVGNNGASVSETVTVPNSIGGGKVVVSQLESGVTPYGEAMKMTLGTEGWNLDKVRVNVNVGSDFEMSGAKGFAFYAKVPAVDASLDPCIDIMLYKNEQQYWNELQPGKPIYYLEKGSQTVTSELFSWDAYSLPLHNRAGFEGFVFIPFDSLKVKYDGADRGYIDEAENLQVRFNVAKTNAELGGHSYIFDEFGFYSDEVKYAEHCLKIDGADVKGMEYLSNSATKGNEARICGTTDTLTLTQLNEAVKMGMAYTVFPSGEGANNFWTEFDMPRESDWDITRTEGIAFYAKLPENTGKGLQVMLYLDDQHYYNDPMSGSTFYYVAKGTDKVEKIKVENGVYPFKGKSGYEGWFFMPYEAMQKNGATATAASVAAAEKLSVRISVISTDTADYNKNYIFDEFGYYSDPLSYIKYVKSFYVDKSANYIANDGSNAADTVIAQWDMSDQIVIEQSQIGVSPYGESISMTNASSGWNMYKTGYVLDVAEDWDLSATAGIAFYVQIPEADIDPALDFLLFINNSDYWYGSLSDAKIYYLADGSDTLTEDYATNLIAHNMQGFSGFVFVPFDSFKGMSGKRGIVNEATRFEWRVNAAQADRALLGKTYVFDELGFYSDPISYAEKAKELHSSYEYVVNDMTDGTTFNVVNGEGVLDAVQSAKGQPFSSALVATVQQNGFASADIDIALKREPLYDVSKTEGIGFYTKLPTETAAAGISVSFTADDVTYTGAASGKSVYYIEKNGKEVLTSAADAVLAGKDGFEGWVFVPFDAINGIDRDKINNAASWRLTIKLKDDTKAVGKSYTFDEIGFYTDPTAYARPVKDVNANYVAESFNSLSSMQTVSQGTELRLVSGKTPYGSALSIVPTKTRSDNTWDHIIINKDSEWRLDSTEGIAMYVRMPGGISETQVTVMLYLNDSLFYPNNTGPVYYVPKNSDGSVVRVSSRQTLYDKVGFEGWVFIPYSSLTAHNGGKINVDDLQNRSSFQIRISHYRLNEDELYKDFIFDEVGFYSDQQMYIDAVKGKYGMSDTASNGNYIANSGDDVDLTTVKRDGNTFTSVSLDERNSPFGSAIAVADTSILPEWHSMRLGAVLNVENNTAALNAKGIAFYARFPNAVDDTYCNLSLYADEYHSYALTSGHLEDETAYTADYVLVDMNGKKTQVNASYALESLQGFEGFVFIPFTSLRDTSDNTKTAADSISYIANSRCEIRFSREFSDRDTYNRTYIIDELGFYKSEDDYIKLAEDKAAEVGNVSGNIIANSCASADTFASQDASALSVEIVGEKTTTGMSAQLTSRYAEDAATSAMLKLDVNSFRIKRAKGVAFWLEAEQSADITFVLKINEILSYEATKSVAAGNKGLVFIPFTDFTDDVAAMTAALDMTAALEARIIQSVPAAGVNLGYIYDSIGFYKDESEYATLVESSFDETNDSIGNYPYTLEQLEYTLGKALKAKQNDSHDSAIQVLEVTSRGVAEQKLTFTISREGKELWQLSKGIAFFADLSKGSAITSLSVKVGDVESKLSNNGFSYLPLADEYGESISATKLSAIDGKKAFVFVEFASLSPEIGATALVNNNTVTLTLGISGLGKTAAIGGVGLYGGERPYIKALRNVLGFGNYILNDGENAKTWTISGDGMYSLSVNGKSPSGKAVALVPMSAGVDNIATATLEKEDGIQKTLGLAFYYNLPSGRTSTDMPVKLQISDTEYWEYIPYAPVYYAADADNISTEKKAALLADKQGVRGYAFIPFSSMNRVYESGGTQKTEALKNNAAAALEAAEGIELIINNKRSSTRDMCYEYIFDTIGVYSDIASYIETANKTATVSYVTAAGFAYQQTNSPEAQLHIINALDNVTDVTATGATVAPAEVNGARAVSVRPSAAFEAKFVNDLYGAEEAKAADGIMLWLETPAGVADPALKVTLTDKNGKKYTFESGSYYYNCPLEGDHIVAMNGKLSLAEFAGNIIIPFDSFTNGKQISFIDVTDVTVSGGQALAGKSIILNKAYAYPALDFLRMSIGDLAARYTVSAADDADAIAVSKDVIRLHDTALTYEKLLSMLEISPNAFSLSLPNGVKGSDKAQGSFELNVMRGSFKVGTVKLEVVNQDIVPDTLIIITPEVPAVPDREVTVTEQVLEKQEVFEDEETPVNELIRVKEAAASLVQLAGDTVTISSVMSAERLMSAFAVADGVKLYIADNDSCLIKDSAGVYNGYYLVVEYDGVKTGFNIVAPNAPVAVEDEGINVMLIIIIAAAALVAIALVILIIILIKRKKRK